jgi:acetoacetyl-CoA synthetase
MQDSTPEILWSPTPESVRASRISAFGAWVNERRDLDLGDPLDYDSLWRWSVTELAQFWGDFATWTEVLSDVPDGEVLSSPDMPGARWFPGHSVNYAAEALKWKGSEPALIVAGEDADPYEVSWDQLRTEVGAFAATLRRLGIHSGDRVVGYLPNNLEAVVAFLGTVSIGAIWSSCAPDFGIEAVVDRFGQIDPTVLVAVDGYRFNGRLFDRQQALDQLRASLPSLRSTIVISQLAPRPGRDDSMTWAEAIRDVQEPIFEPVTFDHPLWVVYSSGTTGLPKGIVHGHGGVVLEQRKFAGLHLDVGVNDRLFWYASTAWIMWNIATSALLSGTTVVVYDGAPTYGGLDAQFALAARTGVTYLGTSAGYLSACERHQLRPGDLHDLSALRGIGSTGSPLPSAAFRWVYDAVKRDVLLGSQSGGTDIATGLIGSSPLLPVTVGELQRPLLGVAVEAWDELGRPVVGAVGELVVTQPMPSMPLYLWNDSDGSRYRSAYFDPWPTIWRHGDWLEITDRGTCVITGRSDSTLNRGGVRMGTADIYAAVETISAVEDCVVLGIEELDGGYWMPLFVQLQPGRQLDSDLKERIINAIRTLASPRHVPDELIAVPGIPRTLTGKRLEVPLKRLFQGVDRSKVVNADVITQPELIDYFEKMAEEHQRSRRKPR